MKTVEIVLPGRVEPEGLRVRAGARPAAGRCWNMPADDRPEIVL